MSYLGNCCGKADEVLPVQIFRIDACMGTIKADGVEMQQACLFTPQQLIDGDVPTGKVFPPFKASLEKYAEALPAAAECGMLVTDWDESLHPRDEDGKFGEGGGDSGADSSSGGSGGNAAPPKDSKGKSYKRPRLNLPREEYGKVSHEISTEFHARYKGKTEGTLYTVMNDRYVFYNFEIHGYGEYNIFEKEGY